MDSVSFSRRTPTPLRARAAAVTFPVVIALACPVAASAGDWGDMNIEPGHTVVLDSRPGRSFSIADGSDTPLPAGWSVISQKGALRITAPSTASSDEYATVRVTESGGATGTFRVTVGENDDDDRDQQRASMTDAPSSSSGASAWLERLAGRVASFFGA